MAGLLGDMEDPRMQGLLSLGFGLMNSRGNFGQALGQAGPQAMDAYNQSAQMLQRRKALEQNMQLQAAQIEETKAQALQRQQQAEELRRKFMEQQRIQQVVRDAVAPAAPINANAASGITGPRPEALAGVGQRAPIDYRALIAAGVPPELVKQLAESGDYGRPEVARTIEQMGAAGPETVQFDKFGGRVGGGIAKPVEAKMMDRGGKIDAYNPFTLATLGSFGKTMTPGEVASNGIAGARLRFDRDQAAGSGQLVETDGGYVRVGKNNTSTPVLGPDGKQLAGKGGVGSEDERKAAGWLSQAETAWKNMRAAGFTKDGKLSSDAKPGLVEGSSWTPEAVANALRSSGRQKFVQAGSSMSEALLRAATGAGVNHDEAQQKIRELTPQIFDSPEVIAQKMNGIPVYLESLRTRAGKALPKGLPPVAPSPLADQGSDPFSAADAIIRGK